MKIKIITYLLLITTFFYGCDKCEETTGATRKVPYYDIPGLFPYSEGGSAKFLRNKLDTVEFQISNLQTSFNYTYTQSDCPEKIPLEQKYMQFIDSKYSNSFYLNYYINSAFYDRFAIVINDVVYINDSPLEFGLKEPIISTTILGKQYDTVTNIVNLNNDSLTFKINRYGLLKFTSKGNLFELIP